MSSTILEEIEDRFDSSTGEVTSQSKHKIVKKQVEPTDEFVKVSRYLNTIFAFNGIPLSLVGISLLLAQRMEWKTNIVYLLKQDKIEIAEALGYRIRYRKNGQADTNTVDKLIADCKKYDIIRPTETRGRFEVNAFLFSTGDLTTTRNLQAHFDFEDGSSIAIADQKNLITGETVRKSVIDRKTKKAERLKKQIPGQLRLDGGEEA